MYTLKPVIEEKESEEGNSMLALLLYPVVLCVDFLVDKVYKVEKVQDWMKVHNFHLQSVLTSFFTQVMLVTGVRRVRSI